MSQQSDGSDSGCVCHLIPTIYRLFGRNSEMARVVRLITSNDPRRGQKFVNHMEVEEHILFPHVNAAVVRRLWADHRRFKAWMKAGRQIPLETLQEHSLIERYYFGLIESIPQLCHLAEVTLSGDR